MTPIFKQVVGKPHLRDYADRRIKKETIEKTRRSRVNQDEQNQGIGASWARSSSWWFTVFWLRLVAKW